MKKKIQRKYINNNKINRFLSWVCMYFCNIEKVKQYFYREQIENMKNYFVFFSGFSVNFFYDTLK